VVPAIAYTLVIVGAIVLIVRKNPRGLFALFLVLLVPPANHGFLFCALTPIMHIYAYVLVIYCYILLDKTDKSPAVCLGTTLLAGIAIFSDTMHIILFSVPVILVSAVYCLSNFQKYIRKLLVGVFSFVVYSGIQSGFSRVDSFVLYPFLQKRTFVEFDLIPAVVGNFFKSLIVHFGGFFFGMSPMDLYTWKVILHFSAFVVFFALFLSVLVRLFRNMRRLEFRRGLDDSVFLDRCLGCAVVIFITGGLVTSLMEHPEPRYVTPVLILGSILIGRNVRPAKEWLPFIVCLIIGYASVDIASYHTIYRDRQYQEIASYLIHNRFGQGYGEYWMSHSVALYTGKPIAPVRFDENGRLVAYDWGTNRAWYGIASRFVIVDKVESVQKITERYGDDAVVGKLRHAGDFCYVVSYPDARIVVAPPPKPPR
jgi:hypothetical protein